jgi:hypothetical protein
MTAEDFAAGVSEAETLFRAGRLDDATARFEQLLRLAPNPECSARAREILDLLHAAQTEVQPSSPAESDEIFGPEDVQNIHLLIANYAQDPTGSNREQMIALQQGLMNFIVSSAPATVEAEFKRGVGEVFRALAASALTSESPSEETQAQLAVLDEALAAAESSAASPDFRPLLARMLYATPDRAAPKFPVDKTPAWVRTEYAGWLGSAAQPVGSANEKELCAVAKD